MRRVLRSSLVIVLLAAQPAAAWFVFIKDKGPLIASSGRALLGTPSGIVVASGAVMLVDPVTARARWQQSFGDLPEVDVDAMAVDLAGDVIVTGKFDVPPLDVLHAAKDAFVAKLDRSTGAQLWRHVITGTATGAGTADGLGAIDVLANGDVVVAGGTAEVSTDVDPIVVRLDGSTGAELWRFAQPQPDHATMSGVAASAAGLVFASGTTGTFALDGATGEVVWSDPALTSRAGIALDSAGDLFVATGEFFPDTAPGVVTKLVGTTGAIAWQRTLATPTIVDVFEDDVIVRSAGEGRRLSATDGSDVWTAPFAGSLITSRGELVGASGIEDAVLWRVDAVTGAVDAVMTFNGAPQPLSTDRFDAITEDATGALVVIGRFEGKGRALVRFDDRLSGDILKLSDDGPGRRLILLKSNDRSRLVPSGGAHFDPNAGIPTANGARLRIWNATTGEEQTFSLPASAWKGSNPQSANRMKFSYKDPKGLHGPCRSVQVQTGGKLSARCLGAGIDFTLDEPTQGSIVVQFEILNGSRQCMAFAGNVTDLPGRFTGRDAPPPASCPPLS